MVRFRRGAVWCASGAVPSSALLARCRMVHVFVSSHLASKVNGPVKGIWMDRETRRVGWGCDITMCVLMLDVV